MRDVWTLTSAKEKAMSTHESATEMTPLEYLKRADEAMASGKHQLASGLLWKATEATIVGLATERGVEGNDIGELAKGLELNGSAEKHHFMSRLVTAKFLKEHADNEIMEDYELEGAYDVTRRFVVKWYGEPN